MEPDRQLDLLGMTGHIAKRREVREAFVEMLHRVVLAMRLGVTASEIVQQRYKRDLRGRFS